MQHVRTDTESQSQSNIYFSNTQRIFSTFLIRKHAEVFQSIRQVVEIITRLSTVLNNETIDRNKIKKNNITIRR